MCYGCWQEYGSPIIDTPAIRAAALAVSEVYQFSAVGGNLHIVLDDWNIEDESLAFCAEQIANKGWKDDRPLTAAMEFMRHPWPDAEDKLAAEQRCHDLLSALSIEHRAAALALQSEFWCISNKDEYIKVRDQLSASHGSATEPPHGQ